MKLTSTEENYVKAIYHLSGGGEDAVNTNRIAEELRTAPASVSDMIKKLAAKKLISYKKYHGVKIEETGRKTALQIIRKHRLWEVFLVEKLQFRWDEVHEVAEQLEHVDSPLLISRLDNFLDNPKVDPHGDPIPDENGELVVGPQLTMQDLAVNTQAVLTAVENSDTLFLKHLDKLGLRLGTKLVITERAEFDGSLTIDTETTKGLFLSSRVAENLLVRNL